MKKIFEIAVVPFITIIISVVLGLIFKDNFIGVVTLIFGFLNAYYMAKGKWYNYIFGILFTFSYGWACFINGLFGWGIFMLIFYVPSQVIGMINWFKNDKDGTVEMKSLNIKKASIVCIATLIGSVIFGYLLSLIPKQQLSFLDSTTQIVNVAGIILSLFRWREAWYLWLINNVLDLSIWTINLYRKNENVEMLFITSIMYLFMNVIGIVLWIKIERKQKNIDLNCGK